MAKPTPPPAQPDQPQPPPEKKKRKGRKPRLFDPPPLKAPKPLKPPKRQPQPPNDAVEEAQVPGQAERRLNLNPELLMPAEEEGNNADLIDHLFSKAFERFARKEEANRGVEAIGEVVSAIQSGRSLKELETKLVPLLSEQASKSSILQATMYNHMMERIALYWDARWRLERSLWEDLREQKLTPREKIALLNMATKEADRAADYINAANASFQPMSDVEPTIEKAGKHSASKVMAEKKKEFEGTTPQGREIIRRLTLKAKDAASKLVDDELAKKKPDGTEPKS